MFETHSVKPQAAEWAYRLLTAITPAMQDCQPRGARNEADSKSDAAKALQEEAGRLEEQGLPVKASGKLQEAQHLQYRAEGLLQRALLLRQQLSGKQAMHAVFILLPGCIQQLQNCSCLESKI